MTSPLAQSARIVAELRERLKAEFGLEDGEDALEDTLDGASDLPEQIARLARDAIRAEAMAQAMKFLIRDNQARKARLEHKGEKLRAAIAWAMEESGRTKVPLPDMTLRLYTGAAPLIVDDAAEMPDLYCRIKREPDKTAIRQALDNGLSLSFARLGNPKPTLAISTK